MEQQVDLTSLLLDKMLDAFRGVVKEMMDSREQKVPAYFTRKEVASKFQISLVTLHEWTTRGLIEAYRVGGRVYYKQEAVEKALKSISKYTPGNAA